jgi:hypothetical protein
LDAVQRVASSEAFQAVALIPLILLPVFGLIWWNDRRVGRTLGAREERGTA